MPTPKRTALSPLDKAHNSKERGCTRAAPYLCPLRSGEGAEREVRYVTYKRLGTTAELNFTSSTSASRARQIGNPPYLYRQRHRHRNWHWHQQMRPLMARTWARIAYNLYRPYSTVVHAHVYLHPSLLLTSCSLSSLARQRLELHLRPSQCRIFGRLST